MLALDAILAPDPTTAEGWIPGAALVAGCMSVAMRA
jgi:hypothetical protein